MFSQHNGLFLILFFYENDVVAFNNIENLLLILFFLTSLLCVLSEIVSKQLYS